MMKKTAVSFIILLAVLISVIPSASAYWIWSPDLGKWINPKGSAKDSPEDQYNWAMQLYNEKTWDRAIEEFEKVPAHFPTSRLAAESVYFGGLCWEQKQDFAKAADAYQKLINQYPYSDRIKDAVKREYDIANMFAEGAKVKVLGVPALPGQEKALELYNHIVKNAPFGTYGDQAQFKIGEVYKTQGEYQDAQKAFQALVDEYPNSSLVSKARYQIAYCSMEASKKAQYDEQHAQQAIEQFQDYKQHFPNDTQAVEAEESIKALRREKAMTNFGVAEFYEKQKKLKSAKIYYEEVINKYPDTPAAVKAKKRLEEMVKQEVQPVKPAGFHLW